MRVFIRNNKMQKSLPMNVSNNSDGRFDMDDVALGHEQLLGLLTDLLDYRLGQKLPLEERFYACVQVQYHLEVIFVVCLGK